MIQKRPTDVGLFLLTTARLNTLTILNIFNNSSHVFMSESEKQYIPVLKSLTKRLLNISVKNKFIHFRNPFEDNPNSISIKTDGKSDYYNDLLKGDTVSLELSENNFDESLEEVKNKFVKFRRQSISSLEETGSNCLFWAFSFLRYVDKKDKKVYWAPLYLMPVDLDLLEDKVCLEYSDTPALTNYSLIEKLRSECVLPEIGEDSPEEYANRISSLIPSNWLIEKTNFLVKVSALNMILFNDLKSISEDEEYLKNRPLIKEFVTVAEEEKMNPTFPATSYSDPASPQIVTEADSSQMQVIKRATLTQDSFVVQGPPGTGKSQTITNIISSLIAEGKRVLFVSEKLAALDVVRGRLEAAKLGPFVLALHNNKVHKKDVVQQLQLSKDYPLIAMKEGLDKADILREKILKYYSFCRNLNSVDANQNLGLFELIWKKFYEQHLLSAPEIDESQRSQFENWSKNYVHAWKGINGYSPVDTLSALGESFSKVEENEISTFFEAYGKKTEGVRFVDECGISYLKNPNISLPDFVKSTVETVPLLQANKHVNIDLLNEVLKEKDSYFSALKVLKTPIFTPEQQEELDKLENLLFEANEYFADQAYISLYPSKGFEIFDVKDATVEQTYQYLGLFVDYLNQLPTEFISGFGFLDSAPIKVIDDILHLMDWLKNGPVNKKLTLNLQLKDFKLNSQLRELEREHAMLSKTKSVLEKNFAFDSVYNDLDDDNIEFCNETIDDYFANTNAFLKWIKSKLNSNVKQVLNFFDYLSLSHTHNKGADEKLTMLKELIAFIEEEHAFYSKVNELKSVPIKNIDNISRLIEESDWLLSYPKLAIPVGVALKHLHSIQDPVYAILPAFIKNAMLLGLQNYSFKEVHTLKEEFQVLAEKLEQLASEFGDVRLDHAITVCELKNRHINLLQKSHTARQNNQTSFLNLNSDQVLELEPLIVSLLKTNPNIWDLESMLDIWEDIDYYKECANFEGHSAEFSRLQKLLGVEIDLSKVGMTEKEYLDYLFAHTDRLNSWVKYHYLKQEGMGLGFKDYIACMESMFEDNSDLADKIISKFDTNSAMSSILEGVVFPEAPTHDELVEYNKFDALIVNKRGFAIGRELSDNVETFEGKHSSRVKELTEGKLLSHLEKYPGARISLREILINARQSILAKKPCFMMGPQAVAQFLDRQHFDFDVVIIDEASQMRLEHSIGAIVRGKRVIVVGDPKQLGPSYNFVVNVDESAELEAINSPVLKAESVLDWAIQRLPSTQLKWHYRSMHPSLIEFSNKNYYSSSLMVMPCLTPMSSNFGFNYQYIENGFSESSINQKEALKIVDKAIAHMEEFPTKSLGIITLNEAQAEYIENAIRSHRFNSIPVRDYLLKWTSPENRFFVKNLENVQGDERDTIIVSMTYGVNFDKNSVKQNFGAISKADGWRRLNVLFSRAKECLIVYSSLKADDIKDFSVEGNFHLQQFLDFAEIQNFQKQPVLVNDQPEKYVHGEYFEHVIKALVYKEGLNLVPYQSTGLPVPMFLVCDDYKALGLIQGTPYFYPEQELRDSSRTMPSLLSKRGWDKIYYLDPLLWLKNPENQAESLSLFLRNLSGSALPSAEEDSTLKDE